MKKHILSILLLSTALNTVYIQRSHAVVGGILFGTAHDDQVVIGGEVLMVAGGLTTLMGAPLAFAMARSSGTISVAGSTAATVAGGTGWGAMAITAGIGIIMLDKETNTLSFNEITEKNDHVLGLSNSPEDMDLVFDFNSDLHAINAQLEQQNQMARSGSSIEELKSEWDHFSETLQPATRVILGRIEKLF